MTAAPEWLRGLNRELHNAEFKIGPAHHIDACRLLEHLGKAGGIDTTDSQTLAPYLAPIYCASVEQQKLFPTLLAAALGQAAETPTTNEPEPAQTTRCKWCAWAAILAVCIAFGVVCVATVVHVQRQHPGVLVSAKPPATTTPPPEERRETAPPGFNKIDSPQPHPTPLTVQGHKVISESAAPRYWVASIPLLLALCWWGFWMLRRNAWLSRIPNRTPQNLQQLSAGARRALSLALDWGRAGHELRRREWAPSVELNVEATLESIVSGTGPPRIVFGSRVEPEYLVLIDETTQSDHLARLGDELMLSLEGRDVALKRFFFRHSPRFCDGPALDRQLRSPGLPIVSLEELVGRYRDHRLIVVTDGKPLFETVTGQPQPWVPLLLQSTTTVLMTPTPVERWGRREWALSALGFTVLPLTPVGLSTLGELYGSERPVKAPAATSPVRRPPRWILDPLSVALPTPPSGSTAPGLCEELRENLGASAFLLLQAAAVYPEIHWGMTLRIGAALLSKADLAESLPRLVRLPWFRDAYMPDWLRAELVATLPPRRAAEVHAILNGLLETARLGSSGDVPLYVGTPPKPAWWETLARGLRLWRGVPRSRLRRDVVFLRFMQGAGKLDVTAGDQIRRLFFRDGVWLQGVRTVPMALVAAVATLLAWQWLSPLQRQRIDVSSTSITPAVTALAMTGDPNWPIMVGYDNGEIWHMGAKPSTRVPVPLLNGGVRRLIYAGGNRFAAGDGIGHTSLFKSDAGSAETWRTEGSPNVPPGDSIVFGRDRAVRLFHAGNETQVTVVGGSGETKTYRTGERGPILCAAFVPGSDDVLVAVFSDGIRKLFPGGDAVSLAEMPTTGCIVRPGGAYIVGWAESGVSETRIWRFNLRGLNFAPALNPHAGASIAEMEMSGNGRVVALLRPPQIEIYDAVTGESRNLVPEGTRHIALSEDGNSIAVASGGGAIELWKRPESDSVPRKAGRSYFIRWGSGPREQTTASSAAAGTADDADLLARVLTQRYHYESLELDRKPSDSSPLAALERQMESLAADDDVVFIFSGLPETSRSGFVENLLSKELARWLSRMAAKRVLFITDALVPVNLSSSRRQTPGLAIQRTRLLLDLSERARPLRVTRTGPSALRAVADALNSATQPVSTTDLVASINWAGVRASGGLTPPLRPILDGGHTGGDFVFFPDVSRGAVDLGVTTPNQSTKPSVPALPGPPSNVTVKMPPPATEITRSPTLTITSGTEADPDGGYDLLVQATPGSPDAGLDQVTLEVNADAPVPVTFTPGGGLLKKHLTLPPGANKVIVQATLTTPDDQASLTRGNEVTSVVNVWVPETRPSLDVLSIGIDQHNDSRLNLSFAAANVAAVAETLTRGGTGFYGSVNASVLTGVRETTLAAIKEGLRTLALRTQPDDVVVVYFCGVTQIIGNQFYLVASDYYYTGGKSTNGLLSEFELKALLDEIHVKKLLLIVEGIDADSMTAPIPAAGPAGGLAKSMRFLTSDTRISVLAYSALQGDVATDNRSSPPRSVFTTVLLSGLHGGAADQKNDRIAVSALGNYVTGAVRQIRLMRDLAKTHGPDVNEQNTLFSSRGQDFVLIRSVAAGE